MQPNRMMILYVNEPPKSAEFYSKILGHEPLDNAPGFAMFLLNDGCMLGLWKRSEVQPAVAAPPGASELGLHVESKGDVDRMHQSWAMQQVTIAQAPVVMGFGYTFTAQDPDGHRIRVFATPS